ncbi:MAG: N-formylglutamate amidohydrolase [Sphingobacterium sp.]|jgi:N-formylglutamate amidohydrolase|nr:N-formylglutamate amidohydrolase [Sphingobacterium sp.]
MSLSYLYQFENQRSPFWAFAIHDGHHIDADLESHLCISPSDRLREEDPYTAILAELPFNRFVCGTSRFQLDLNRNKDGAVYLTPEQSWGIQVWGEELPPQFKNQLYESYDMLYQKIVQQLEHTIERYGYFVVYDIHSYNARRDGPDAPIDEVNNPQINIGTAHNHLKWQGLTALFLDSLRNGKDGQVYDVRENVKFKGGFLSAYLNEKFGDKGCIFSIEFRKDFMNEWTGEVFPQKLQEYKQLLMQSIETLESYFAYER